MKLKSRADAKAAGETKYFTGKPCKHGHKAPRYVSSGSCEACLLLHKIEWQSANIEKVRASKRNWIKKHPERMRELQRRYHHANKARAQAKRRTYAKNKPHKFVEYASSRRAAKLNRTPKWLDDVQRQQIAEMYECAKELSVMTGESWEVDHIVPMQGECVSGLHVPWNLQLMPKSLNSAKKNKWKVE
jgi:5-methylcytosine-specific restriction endonuclease McrA